MFTRPQLLQHPNIPKPMHGLSPRSIMGQEWWDRVRQEAYSGNGFCCWACGVHKLQAAFHHWLEAHETYQVDYGKGRMVFDQVVALCHACHNFIHLGRLRQLYKNGTVNSAKFDFVVRHGYRVLADAGLEPWWGTREAVEPKYQAPDSVKKQDLAAWQDWRLIFNGKEYAPIHADYDIWRVFYSAQK